MKKNKYERPAACCIELQTNNSFLLEMSMNDDVPDLSGSDALSRKRNGWCSTNWTSPDGYWTGSDETDY